MALQLRRSSPIKVRFISTLMMVMALVAQPFYGVVAGQVANAATSQVLGIKFDTPERTVKVGQRSEKITVSTYNTALQPEAVDNGTQLELISFSPTGRFARQADDSFGRSSRDRIAFTGGTTSQSFYYKDTTPGVARIAVAIAGGVHYPTVGVGAGQSITVSAFTPAITPSEFTTISDTVNYYKGIDAGFSLNDDFGTLQSLKVDLYDASGIVATNTATQKMLDYYATGGRSFTTPFVVEAGKYNPATETYWNFSNYTWDKNSTPTKVVITAQGTNGNVVTAENSSLSLAGGSFESLFPVPAPTILPCVEDTQVDVRSVDSWFDESRSGGTSTMTPDGLHVTTNSNTSEDKAAKYLYGGTASFALKDAGAPSIEFGAYTGVLPSLQLAFDKDGNGSWDGFLVYEPLSYGEGNWWSNKDFNVGAGGGYPSMGTLQDYLNANPNARVLGFGYSLGSGVKGDAIIKSITAGCTKYVFASLPIDKVKPTIDFTNPSRFNDVSYNKYFAAGPNIAINASDASGIKNTLLHVYKADKTPAKYCPVSPTDTTSCDTSSFAAGDYYVVAAANDTAGNSVYVTKYFSVDTMRPEVHINLPTDNSYSKTGNFTVEGTATDDMSGIDHVSVYVAHNPWSEGGYVVNSRSANFDSSTGQFTTDVSGLADGTYVVKAIAYDKAGNYRYANAANIIVDTKKPVVAFAAPTDFTKPFQNGPTIQINATDQNGSGVASSVIHVYNSDDTSVKFCPVSYADTASCDVSNLPSGKYYVKAGATDNAGNIQVIREDFTIDGIDPSIHITAPTNNARLNSGSFTVTGSAYDDQTDVARINIYVSKVTAPDANGKTFGGYVVNNQPVTNYDSTNKTFSYDVSGLDDGKYSIKAVAFDQAGNTQFANSPTVTVDSTAPLNFVVNNLSVDDTNYINTSDYTITGSVEGASEVELCIVPVDTNVVTFDSGYTCNDQSVTASVDEDGAWTLDVPADALQEGDTYKFVFIAKDEAGNTTTPVVRDVVFDTVAPVVKITGVKATDDGNSYLISGTTDDTADVYVTIDGSTYLANVADGVWTVANVALQPSTTYTVTANSTDAAGNYGTAASKSYVVNEESNIEELPTTSTSRNSTSNSRTSTASTTPSQLFALNTTPSGNGAVNGDDTGVLGAETTNGTDSTNSDGEVKSATDTAAVIAPSQDGWKIFGMAWYYWLIIAALVASAFYAIARRRNQDA